MDIDPFESDLVETMSDEDVYHCSHSQNFKKLFFKIENQPHPCGSATVRVNTHIIVCLSFLLHNITASECSPGHRRQ